MTIQQATRKALSCHGSITLPEFIGKTKITPIEDRPTFVLSQWDGSHPRKHGWTPTAEELLREDWQVVEDDGTFMSIQEAIREALSCHGSITLPENFGKFKITPAEGRPFILSLWDGSHPCKYGWNPCAEDLLREHWMVVRADQSPIP